MKKFLYKALFFVSIIGMSACSSDDTDKDSPDEEQIPLLAEEFEDISYGSDTDQVYDLFLPADRTSETKIIVLVHGGGWTRGDKEDIRGFQVFLEQELPDLAVVNMNYRLADNENPPYPMQIDDITAVITDLKNKKDTYVISEDIGFVGISAGAHLSLLWSYAFDTDDQVNMVCSIVGPTNFLDEAYLTSEDPFILEFKDNFNSSPTFLEEVSPLFQVKASSPPTALFYGGQDSLIPNTQGFDMDAKLTELGVPHEFTFYENEGHGWVGLNLFDTSAKLKAFIEEHL